MERRKFGTPVLLVVVLIVSMLGWAGSVAAKPPIGDQGGKRLFTDLTGAEEVPPADPDGTGSALITLNHGQGQVCWEVTTADIATPTVGHIHVGDFGAIGPPVVHFTGVAAGTFSGCASADRDLIKDIMQNPENYYVNIHNADFPNGAVRGQLG